MIRFVAAATTGATVTELTISPNPSNFSETIELTALVSSRSGPLNGSVEFYDGERLLGSAALSAGTAVLSVTDLGPGSHVITARYPATGPFLGSISPSVEQVVAAPGSFMLAVMSSGDGSGTITSAPQGIACPDVCAAPFAAGAQVVLTATPAPGSMFEGWSGACTGAGSCTLVFDADISVSAAFRRTAPDLITAVTAPAT